MLSHRARRICLSRCGGGMVSKGSREGGTGATKHSSRGVQTEASQLNLQGPCASQVGRLTVVDTSSTNDCCVPGEVFPRLAERHQSHPALQPRASDPSMTTNEFCHY